MSKEEETPKAIVTTEEHNFNSKKAWQKALNAAPSGGWIKERTLGGAKKSTYLPIQYQQALQDIFFDAFDVIDARSELVVNEIVVHVKCQGLPSYPNAEYRYFSGLGSKPVQCDSGASVAKFPLGKKTNALEYNLPAARTAAISNALSTIGNIFGRNLGRAISSDYNLSKNEEAPKKKSKKAKNK
ncbi:hypothetical protein Phi47:1_gp41 [Cellulophaga phage phi47:1]|uniref:hypothetical protein n=1 Tax=Cellulophaga phage phiSM TaxID=756280 RepID=UPI0002B7985C|nr:hypothetical protein CEPG_00043 [Cellulophaga phage phiSM]AGF91629.1 hypothetical protein CDPG_00025 [Cellulophaga phage phi47:1]AGO47772.1 hypothetical protein Phi3ST:2_gp41 [Cellulophaga phage phi3ST:2]AGO49280.1 hypothetical protein Phi38:2_gp41 [Cellulophaga phage phi38:2]AGO49360.1 hypothetical protein Phi3:1_gp41 [Cellulophaga phage phi3:1]AGH07791.1 hypothetical protein CEPG_00043 [Cellulophaga phage phiSM]